MSRRPLADRHGARLTRSHLVEHTVYVTTTKRDRQKNGSAGAPKKSRPKGGGTYRVRDSSSGVRLPAKNAPEERRYLAVFPYDQERSGVENRRVRTAENADE